MPVSDPVSGELRGTLRALKLGQMLTALPELWVPTIPSVPLTCTVREEHAESRSAHLQSLPAA